MNTAVATQPENPMLKFSDQLEGMADKFRASLPEHIPVERFKRVVMVAVQHNTDLLYADRQSFWTAAMKCANDGLLPDGREAALVVFNTEVKRIEKGKEVKKYIKAVNYLPMIAGLRKKVRNSKEIATWETAVVYQFDKFVYMLGDNPSILHEPNMTVADRGTVVAAYSIAVLKSGEISREVMTRVDLEKIRAASKRKSDAKDSPAWRDWESEMFRKAVAKRHYKVLPSSTDLDDLMRADDDLYDFKGVREQEPPPERPTLRQFSTPPANPAENITEIITDNSQEQEQTEQAHDPETGEVATEPSPADAWNLGRDARSKGTPLKAVPPEWREAAHEPLATAWQAGWNERDAEIAAKVKGAT